MNTKLAGRIRFALPPPLWGRAGEGGDSESGVQKRPPSRLASLGGLPHKGGGNDDRTARFFGAQR